MQLNYKEMTALNEFLGFVVDGFIQTDAETTEVLSRIQGKLSIELADIWKPLSELPPLNMKVIVKSRVEGTEREMIRKDLADSYSPTSLLMYHDDKPEILLTNHYQWRLA